MAKKLEFYLQKRESGAAGRNENVERRYEEREKEIGETL